VTGRELLYFWLLLMDDKLSQGSHGPLEKGLRDPYCRFASGWRRIRAAVQIQCTLRLPKHLWMSTAGGMSP
jgi:hypothetical protein